MSDDHPKGPFDAAPNQTPELLQKNLNLERRNARVPTFEELRTPAAPPRKPPVNTAVLPRPAPQPKAEAPPSPTDWAELQRRSGPASAPVVITPAEPALGASVPPGQPARSRPERNSVPLLKPSAGAPKPPATTVPPAIPPVSMPVPRAPLPATRVAPAHQPANQSAAQPAGLHPSRPLPASMFVTQPGVPGPFPRRPALSAPIAAATPPRSEAEVPPSPARAEPPQPRPARAAPAGEPENAKVTTETTVMATPAGLFRRLVAWVVDLSLISIVAGVFLAGAVFVIAPKGLSMMRGLLAISVPALLLGGVLSFVYTTLFAFLFQGKTPGRRLAGIRLVDGTGSIPGPGRALIRAALSLVSFGLFLSGFWLGLFDRRGQTLHDKLSRTFVVRFLDA